MKVYEGENRSHALIQDLTHLSFAFILSQYHA